MKIHPVRTKLFHADGQNDRWTDMTKLIVVFYNFVNASKNHKVEMISYGFLQLVCIKIWSSKGSVVGPLPLLIYLNDLPLLMILVA
jgi:hypothetical protein